MGLPFPQVRLLSQKRDDPRTLPVDDEFQCLARTSHNFVSNWNKKTGVSGLGGGWRRSCASQKFLAPLPVGRFFQLGGSSALVIEKIEPLSDQK